MSPKAEKVLEAALKLPPRARAALAGSLIHSLDTVVDDDAETAWTVEVTRRVNHLKSGAARPRPWPEARRIIACCCNAFRRASRGRAIEARVVGCRDRVAAPFGEEMPAPEDRRAIAFVMPCVR